MLNISTCLTKPLMYIITSAMLVATISPVTAAEQNNSPKTVALINGVAIYESELSSSTDDRIRQYRQLGSKLTDAELQRRFQLKELDVLIAQELLAQAGAALKPQGLEEKIAKRLAVPTANSADKAPLTKEQLEARNSKIRKDILIESYLEHKGLLNAKVDEQTMRNFYDNNRQSFREPKSIKASHILIQLPKKPTAEQERIALDKANKILTSLKQGKDFSILAIQESDCSSKNDGGSLGFIKQNFLPKELDDVAFSLKPGETSGIIKTRHGLHIILVEETKPESITEYEIVKPYIAGYLQKDFQRVKVDELVNELKKTAKTDILIK